MTITAFIFNRQKLYLWKEQRMFCSKLGNFSHTRIYKRIEKQFFFLMKSKLKLPCMIPSNLPNTSFCNMGSESAEKLSQCCCCLYMLLQGGTETSCSSWENTDRQAKGKIHKLEHCFAVWGITCRVHAAGLTASPGVIPSSHQCCEKWEFCMPLSWMLGLTFPFRCS